MSEAERWTIESPRFGSIEVERALLITFDGIPGFPELRQFLVLQHDRNNAFGWLQSVEKPEVAFPVIDPRPLVPAYQPVLREVVLKALDVEPGGVIDWLAIATVREGVVTVNLAAPLLINPVRRRGVQAILEGDQWSTREPLLPAEPSPAGSRAPVQMESKPQTNSGQGSRVESARS